MSIFKSFITLLACLTLALSLAACGKKPPRVDSPSDTDDDTFPLIYPDPATDPAATPTSK